MDKENIIKIEEKAIKNNLFFVFIMAISGLFFGTWAHSSAIILDGIFSLVIFITMLLSIIIKLEAKKPKSYKYPVGKAQIEELYILFKLLVLSGILLFSFITACIELVRFFGFSITPKETIVSILYVYSFVKLLAFVCSLSIYKYYYKKTSKLSDFIKVEMQGVKIDGYITLSILIGFLVLKNFAVVSKISDPIILLLMSIFLLSHILKDLKDQFNRIIGKRTFEQRELYYKGFFNNYFVNIHFRDVFIQKQGNNIIVNICYGYENKKSSKEIYEFEKVIKSLLYDEFGDVYLQTYVYQEH